MKLEQCKPTKAYLGTISHPASPTLIGEDGWIGILVLPANLDRHAPMTNAPRSHLGSVRKRSIPSEAVLVSPEPGVLVGLNWPPSARAQAGLRFQWEARWPLDVRATK